MRIIGLDFETFYDTEQDYGIKQLGAVRYCEDPRFDPYLISVSDGSDSWAGQPRNFNWNALEGAELLSHYKYFDSQVYKSMVKRGMAPQIQFANWHCTANLSVYLSMRRDLARASEFLLGVSMDKEVRDNADGKHWADMEREGSTDSMLAYARGDALRCWQIWAKYGHLWPASERRLSELTINQGQRGAQIDLPRLEKYLVVAQQMLIQAETNLPWMREGKKPTSTKAIAEECRKEGIPCPPVKSRDGEDAYDEWAAIYAPKHKWVKAYTDYRVINKFITTLLTIKNRLSPESIFSFDLLYFGAHTGRWAGAGGFNMQNMRKEPLFCDTDGWLITDTERLKEVANCKGHLPDYVAHVLDIRALFIARPGRKLIISDLSQIEPRVLAWLVNDTAMLSKMLAGQSPYQAHAEATMGWIRGDMKELIKQGQGDVKDIYQLAKARVLGLGFGCGWEKFITVAQTLAGLDITADDPEWMPALNEDGEQCFDALGKPKMVSGYGAYSKKVVSEYRASNPLVTGLWKQLDEAFRNSEGGDFQIQLPSGRYLRYPEVRRERKTVADPDNPKKFKNRLVYTALAFDNKRNGVVRKPFYGGLLTENLVQASARDVFGECLIRLMDTPGVDPLWSEHDAAVNEVDMSVTVKDIQEQMTKTPTWLPGCPISAETVESPHYLK